MKEALRTISTGSSVFRRFPASLLPCARTVNPQPPKIRPILIKSEFRLYRVTHDDVVYLKKVGNYITYFLVNGKNIGSRQGYGSDGQIASSFYPGAQIFHYPYPFGAFDGKIPAIEG